MESYSLLGASTLFGFVTRLDGTLMILGQLTCTLMILVLVVVVVVLVLVVLVVVVVVMSEDGFRRLNTQHLCEKISWWIAKQQISPPRSHSLDKPATGSIYKISWSADGTQVALNI